MAQRFFFSSKKSTPQQQQSTPHKGFSTQHPHKSTIRHTIKTTGSLHIKNSSKVGSLVAGIVKTIEVKENQSVKKGQLLATLDNGKGDTAIRIAQGALMRAQASHQYYKKVYEREKTLFASGLTSEQDLEKHELAYKLAQGDVLSAQAQLEVAQIEYKNTYIYAPEDGVVIAIGIKQGFKVTTDLNATVLFTIARDITSMEALLEVDESDIAHVAVEQKVSFSVDSHPGRVFKGILSNIRFAPVKKNNEQIYEAILDVSNDTLQLRPGMTVHATIKVAKAKDTLSVASQAFYFDYKTIKFLADRIGYTCKPLDKKEKKRCMRCGDKEVRFAWVVKDNCLIEKPITIGAYDTRNVEAQSGIEESDDYIIDVEEADAMDEYYKKMFKGVL